jgi:hypothetical protein
MSTGGDDKIRLDMDAGGFVEGAKTAQQATTAVKAEVDLAAEATARYTAALQALADRQAAGTITANELIEQGTALAGAYGIEVAAIEKATAATVADAAAEKTAATAATTATTAKVAGTAAATASTAAVEAETVAHINSAAAMQNVGRIAVELASGRVYGLMGSVQRLTASLGGPQGLALGIGAAAFALYELRHPIMSAIDELSGYNAKVDEAKDHLEHLKDKIKELSENPLKMRAQIEELENAKEVVERIEKSVKAVAELEAARSPIVKEAGKRAISELEGGFPAGDELKARLIDQAIASQPGAGRQQQLSQEITKLKKDLEDVKAHGAGLSGLFERRNIESEIVAKGIEQKGLEDKAREQAVTDVGSVLDRAKGGDAGAIGQLGVLVRGIGEPELAGRIELQTPMHILGERIGKVLDKFKEKAAENIRDAGKEVEKAADEAAYGVEVGKDEAIAQSGKEVHRKLDAIDKRQHELDQRMIALVEKGWTDADALAEATAELGEKAAGHLGDFARMFKAANDRIKDQTAEGKQEARAEAKLWNPSDTINPATAKQIEMDTGADKAHAQWAAKRALDLNKAGWQANAATLEAVAQMQRAVMELEAMQHQNQQALARVVHGNHQLTARVVHHQQAAAQDWGVQDWGGPR